MKYDPEGIIGRLSEMKAGYILIYTDKTGSTNDDAKRAAENGAPDKTVFLAGEQTNGRGRLGRTWESERDGSLTFSVLVRPDMDNLSLVTAVMGLAAADAIENVTGVRTGIKWPNDVIIGTQKVCGILTEAGSDLSYAVIGVGVNTGKLSFKGELDGKAVSLYETAEKTFSREDLLCETLRLFDRYLKEVKAYGSFLPLKERFEERLVNIGRDAEYTENGKKLKARAVGVDDACALVVLTEDGKLTSVISSEVSVRGIYGYV